MGYLVNVIHGDGLRKDLNSITAIAFIVIPYSFLTFFCCIQFSRELYFKWKLLISAQFQKEYLNPTHNHINWSFKTMLEFDID